MKKVLVSIGCFVLLGCASKKFVSSESFDCPENHVCTITKDTSTQLHTQIVTNNTLNIVKQPNEYSTVYTLEMNREVNPKYVDGQYQEQLLFNLPVGIKELELKDEDLQNIKLTFGRFCYCKGYTGYYTINKGHFSLQDNLVKIHFKIEEVPQVLDSVYFKLP